MSDHRPTLAYFGHHKCATTWIDAINVMVCRELGLQFTNVHNAGMFDRDLKQFVKKNGVEFLSYTNANWDFAKDLDKVRGFHVIRDPRDIVVSAYFSHLHSHPTDGWPALVEHRNKLQSASQGEGLLLEMEMRRPELETLANWDYANDDILEIKMEAIMVCPYEPMVQCFAHLGLIDDDPATQRGPRHRLAGLLGSKARAASLTTGTLLNYVYQNRFSKVAEGRQQGQEDVKSHYRKGVAGDWVNYFEPQHRRIFKENFGDLLIKLGYEKDSDW